ncbi:hypothetical protein IAT40_007910 [Kwoniella sp. CBS 6097]
MAKRPTTYGNQRKDTIASRRTPRAATLNRTPIIEPQPSSSDDDFKIVGDKEEDELEAENKASDKAANKAENMAGKKGASKREVEPVSDAGGASRKRARTAKGEEDPRTGGNQETTKGNKGKKTEENQQPEDDDDDDAEAQDPKPKRGPKPKGTGAITLQPFDSAQILVINQFSQGLGRIEGMAPIQMSALIPTTQMETTKSGIRAQYMGQRTDILGHKRDVTAMDESAKISAQHLGRNLAKSGQQKDEKAADVMDDEAEGDEEDSNEDHDEDEDNDDDLYL